MMDKKLNEMEKKLTEQNENLDRKLTDFQGEMRKERNEVKTRLDKIEKITDRVEKNEQAIQEIKAENKEIKDKIEEINLNNIMEEASRSVYIHNVDVLIGMHEPRKHNQINWTETIRGRCNHSQGRGSNQMQSSKETMHWQQNRSKMSWSKQRMTSKAKTRTSRPTTRVRKCMRE